jgi:hypothetical protein
MDIPEFTGNCASGGQTATSMSCLFGLGDTPVTIRKLAFPLVRG